MSSPVANFFEGLVAQVSAGSELAGLVGPPKRAHLLAGLFDSYYADVDREVIFDTSRAWTAQANDLLTLYPQARILCCVRDVAWVMDSLKRQYRAHAFENTRLFNSAAERATVYTRVETLAHANRLVGFAWHALREACFSDVAERLMLIEYDLLCHRPRDVLRLVYEFLGEEPFDHDFTRVSYDAPDFDAALGLAGLHRVRPKVEPQTRRSILPPDLFAHYGQLSFWRDMPTSKAYRVVARPTQAQARDMPEARTSIAGTAELQPA
jgi:sulfotransferase